MTTRVIDIDEIVLNYITEKIVVYIAGYTVRYLKNKLKCIKCIESLVSNNTNNNYYSIIKAKNKGGLIYPSEDVIKICLKSEEILKFCYLLSGGKLLDKKYNVDYLTTRVLSKFINTDIFDVLKDHMFEQSQSENHMVHLIKAVSCKYFNIRIQYLSRREADKVESLRKIYGKLIIHRGQ